MMINSSTKVQQIIITIFEENNSDNDNEKKKKKNKNAPNFANSIIFKEADRSCN